MKAWCIIRSIDGKPASQKKIADLFAQLKDGMYKIEATTFGKRSLSANGYYWMILTDYVQPGLYDAGWREIKTKDDAHFFVSNIFLKERIVNENTGDEMVRIKSTASLSVKEFGEYLEEIIQWAAEYLSIAIPEPDKQLALNYE
jgi:hypothetical protein